MESALREHPTQSYYGIKVKARQTLTEALKNGDLWSLGQMREFEQAIDMMTLNPSMRFEKLPKTGEQPPMPSFPYLYLH